MMRFVLVDYLHLVYKCMAAPALSCIIFVDNEKRVVDTVIPNFTCKDVWRFSGNGKHPTGVFLEGGAPLRKMYFNAVTEYKEWYNAIKTGAEYVPVMDTGKTGYKAGRSGLNNSQKLGINLAIDCFTRGQLSCYQVPGYEADDLIWTAYTQLRAQYPDAQIDIITGDMDMLPMVDEHTSVYLRGNRTWADPLCDCHLCNCGDKNTCEKYADDSCKIRREFKNYFQVTPENWDEFISYRSAFKGFHIPYNSVYLFKMLRGDDSDNVPMVEKGWGGKKWNGVIDKMIADGVDFAKTFRYDTPWATVEPVLLKYFPAETVAFMKLNAEGIRPRSNMGELINLIPLINTDDGKIDVPTVYNTLIQGLTYVPETEGIRKRAEMVLQCAKQGVDLSKPVTLMQPKIPDLGHFQIALNTLKINLPQKTAAY